MSYQTHELDPRWVAVDEYSFSHLHPSSTTSSLTPLPSALDFARKNSEEQGLPDIAVSPSQGKFLMLQAQLLRAKHILEVGTLGGYSTIWLASLGKDVHVTTVEVDAHHASVAQQNLQHAGVADRVNVLVGPGTSILPQLVADVSAGQCPKFDFVFIDADKQNNCAYVDTALGMCVSGACIIVDNIARGGRLADEGCRDEKVKGSRNVVEKVGKDERVDGVVVQTVGDKGYDGFLFVRVK